MATGAVKVVISAALSSAVELGTGTYNIAETLSQTLSSGTGNDRIDLVFGDQRTTSSQTDTLDLAGSLTDVFGNTITFVDVKVLYIKASSSNTDNVVVGGAATNAFASWVSNATDEVIIQPDGAMLLVAPNSGYSVTAGTGDILEINSSGATEVTYDIVLLGASA